MALLLIILLIGGTGLLAFVVKSLLAAGILGVIALAVIIALLLRPRAV